jgi:hypothetical protein
MRNERKCPIVVALRQLAEEAQALAGILSRIEEDQRRVLHVCVQAIEQGMTAEYGPRIADA